MATAKLFRNGHSQAVRLPREFAFEGDEVYVRRVGRGVLLFPKSDPWAALEAATALFTDDFLDERVQPPLDERESL